MQHGFDIFLDLDGVICDFESRVRELISISKVKSGQLLEASEVDHAMYKKMMWKVIESYDRHTPFFYTLDKMSDADDLLEFVSAHFDSSSIKMLTASGSTPSDAPQQKRRWVRKHVGNYHVEVVLKSPDKAVFASPRTILVDDRSKSIDPWIAAGGIGILHTDAQSTIKRLKDVLMLS